MVTACLWRQASDDHWHTGNIAVPSDRDDPDGAEGLLELVLDCSPDGYQQFAEEYYEVSLDPADVAAIFALRPLTDQLVTALNPHRTLAELAEDLDSVGYPTAARR